MGDSYLYAGDLYVCVDSRDGNDYFINVGSIQGPKGNDGQSSYVFIKYATDANGANMSASPTGKTYIGVHISNTNTAPTTESSYTWSKFVGENAKSIILNGDSQVFKVGKTSIVPETITVMAQTLNTSITTWTYSTNGGQSFLSTVPTGVSRNGNTVVIAGSTITSNSIVIKASDGTYSDTYTVYKAVDGADGSDGIQGAPAPIAFLNNENISFSANANGQVSQTKFTINVVAYSGTTKVTPNINKDLIVGLPDGMTVGNPTTSFDEVSLEFSIANNSTLGAVTSTSGVITIPVTSPVSTNLKLNWSKINTGATGAQGAAGSDAYTVMLTNESHIFAGNISNALAGSATTQVLAYKGVAEQDVTITSVNGKTAAVIDTDTGIAGLKFRCSALNGKSPTITFTCTTSFVSASGTIPIVFTVGGITFTKMFTYSIAFKGATGGVGPTGATGDAASLVDVTPSAFYFKSTTGKDGTFTPEYIYLYPRFQTVSYGKWEYSTNGGTTWAEVASGSNGLTIGTYNSTSYALRVSRSSALYTDTVTSISFRCVSSNSSVYDTVSVAKIYDVVDLQVGGRNLILASNNPVTSTDYLVASYQMSEDWEIGTTYTITIKGNVNAGQSFGIWANGSMSKVASLTYNAARGVHIATFTPMTITTQTAKMLRVYNTPSDAASEASIEWIKLERGNKSTDWMPAPEDLKVTTFQLYAPKGYLITNEVPEVTLQAFAYDGSYAITNATFEWFSWSGDAWDVISGATSTSLTVGKASVMKTKVYKCEMTYNGAVYETTATIEDKTDIYDSLINVVSKYSPSNRLYWVLYSTVYTEEGEQDKLLGPISATAPASPVTGAYWYKVNETDCTVTLMKYSGTAWAETTDKQELVYDWSLLNDANNIISLGSQGKVKIITSSDFSKTCSVQCNIRGTESVPISYSNQILIDPSDPVVSSTEPTNPTHGQLWIKTGANGLYALLVWDASLEKWVVSETDSRVKVHISKPTSYEVGDVWVVGGDYEPTVYINGVAQTTKHLAGTMLKAQYSSQSYRDSDWVEALNYKKDINDLKENLNMYNQFFSADADGLVMQDKDKNVVIIEFKTKLTHSELGFYQGENKVAHINNNQLNISKAEITNGMTITGSAPVLEIGNFTIIQESNGSLSIGLKS